MLQHLKHRPGLLIGFATAVVAGLIAHQFMATLSSALAGWCAGVLAYLAVDFWIGRVTVLIITVGAAVASLAAIVVNLSTTRDTYGVILAGGTVLLSWVFVHTVFTFTYAHDFYKENSGINFPGTPEPDYWDFAYFAFVIGATSQVSDVSISSSGIRRLALAHGIISFFFNTAVLAFGVNLAAGLVA